MENPLCGLIVASFPPKLARTGSAEKYHCGLFLKPTPSCLIALNVDFLLLVDSESSRVSTQFSTSLKALHCGFQSLMPTGILQTHIPLHTKLSRSLYLSEMLRRSSKENKCGGYRLGE